MSWLASRTRFALGTVVVSTALSLAAAEVFCRFLEEPSGRLTGLLGQLQLGRTERSGLMFDPELGYMPDQSEDSMFSTNGILKEESSEARTTGSRVLFMGDSVTARGRIIRALRAAYGSRPMTFLNAGVEGYNANQEVGVYRRSNSREPIDEVVLTFHVNDLTYDVVTYVTRDYSIVFYLEGTSPVRANGHLLSISAMFRRYILFRVDKMSRDGLAANQLYKRTFASLAWLKAALNVRKVRFTVLLFPMMQSPGEWDSEHVLSLQQSRQMFQELGIRYIDLMPVLEAAIQAGEEISEAPGDPHHPNDLMSARIAAYCKEKGLFTEPRASVGGPDRDRTRDLPNAVQARPKLRYRPTGGVNSRMPDPRRRRVGVAVVLDADDVCPGQLRRGVGGVSAQHGSRDHAGGTRVQALPQFLAEARLPVAVQGVPLGRLSTGRHKWRRRQRAQSARLKWSNCRRRAHS